MVHTLPDYTTRYKMVKIFGQIDNNELACRLGSSSTEDRRGNIVWSDDFESTTKKWALGASGTGSTMDLVDTVAHRGNGSVKCVTGNNTSDLNFMLKRFTLPSEHKVGTEIYVDIIDKAIKLTNVVQGYSAPYYFGATVEFDVAADTIKVTDENDVQHTLDGTIPYNENEPMWVMYKLVIDWATKKYVRLILGNDTYDLSEYGLKQSPTTKKDMLQVWYFINPTLDANKTMYFDDFILTQNEP